MSTIPQKMDKQFDYQRTRYVASGDPMDLFVSVDHLAEYLVTRTRTDRGRVRQQVKAEMERRADAGEARRWAQVHGPSLRKDRADHYFLLDPH